jgi:GTPase SAR1 family protein
MYSDEDEMFKIVIVGASATGKTCIASRFVKDEFHMEGQSTVGV